MISLYVQDELSNFINISKRWSLIFPHGLEGSVCVIHMYELEHQINILSCQEAMFGSIFRFVFSCCWVCVVISGCEGLIS